MNNILISLLRKIGNPYMTQAADVIERQDEKLLSAEVREKNNNLQIAVLNAEVERLKKQLSECKNELCYRCGDYKMRHKGACDGCLYRE